MFRFEIGTRNYHHQLSIVRAENPRPENIAGEIENFVRYQHMCDVIRGHQKIDILTSFKDVILK